MALRYIEDIGKTHPDLVNGLKEEVEDSYEEFVGIYDGFENGISTSTKPLFAHYSIFIDELNKIFNKIPIQNNNGAEVSKYVFEKRNFDASDKYATHNAFNDALNQANKYIGLISSSEPDLGRKLNNDLIQYKHDFIRSLNFENYNLFINRLNLLFGDEQLSNLRNELIHEKAVEENDKNQYHLSEDEIIANHFSTHKYIFEMKNVDNSGRQDVLRAASDAIIQAHKYVSEISKYNNRVGTYLLNEVYDLKLYMSHITLRDDFAAPYYSLISKLNSVFDYKSLMESIESSKVDRQEYMDAINKAKDAADEALGIKSNMVSQDVKNGTAEYKFKSISKFYVTGKTFSKFVERATEEALLYANIVSKYNNDRGNKLIGDISKLHDNLINPKAIS